VRLSDGDSKGSGWAETEEGFLTSRTPFAVCGESLLGDVVGARRLDAGEGVEESGSYGEI